MCSLLTLFLCQDIDVRRAETTSILLILYPQYLEHKRSSINFVEQLGNSVHFGKRGRRESTFPVPKGLLCDVEESNRLFSLVVLILLGELVARWENCKSDLLCESILR